MVTMIDIRGKRAFIFNPPTLPCVVSIGNTQYFFRDIDAVRDSKTLGIFKEELLNLLQHGGLNGSR
jgi:hypothetical protein